MEKYTTEQLREAACALWKQMPCDKKPETHNCVKTCWAYKDKTRADLVELLDGDADFIDAYFKDWEK